MRKKLIKQTALLMAMIMTISVAGNVQIIEAKNIDGAGSKVITDCVFGTTATEEEAGLGADYKFAKEIAGEETSENTLKEISTDGENTETVSKEITLDGETSKEMSEGITSEGQTEVTSEGITYEGETEETSEEITSEGETEETSEVITTEEITTEEITSEEETTEEETTTEEITTPEETTTPEFSVYSDVYKVKNATGELVEYLGNKADTSVKELTIAKEVKIIGKEFFKNYEYIETVRFEEGSQLTDIGDYAFSNCDALAKIELPEGLINMGYRTFQTSYKMTELTIPSTVVTGTQILGKKSNVKKVIFATGMKTIPVEILRYGYSVEAVEIPEGVTSISKRAFYQCTSLKEVYLPSTLTSIKTSVFNGCTALSKVDMSSALKSINDYAFKNCTSLKSIRIPKATKTFGKDIFAGNPWIVLKVYANSKGKAYARANNFIWEYTDSELERQAANTAIYNNYMSLIRSKDKNKFQMAPYLQNYIPQGTCLIGKYLVVSMYYKKMKKNSILVLYDRYTGKLVKTITLPSKDHVGSVANVKGRLVVSLNNISATDYVAVISLSKLKKTKNGKKVKYDYRVKLPGYADFTAFDGKMFWAGRSVNSTKGTMQGYNVKVKNKKLVFTQKYSLSVPANCQGLVAIKDAKTSKRTFIISQSYGRLNNSKLLTYEVKIKKTNTVGEPVSVKTLPSMVEGIALSNKGYLFMAFESGAGYYCGNPDNTSEIQVNNVCQVKRSKLNKLTQ